MTDHLPECYDALIPDFHNERWVCICAALRACEKRVWKVAYNQGLGAGSDMHGEHEKGWVKGYAAGVQAAREAVLAMVIETVGNSAATVEQVLAAIDALREEHK